MTSRFRKPPRDLLAKCGLEMPPSEDGLYSLRDGIVTFHQGSRSWSGPAEADNASKRLCVGMYALQSQESWDADGRDAPAAFAATRALYAVREGMLEDAGRVTVTSIMLELYQLDALNNEGD